MEYDTVTHIDVVSVCLVRQTDRKDRSSFLTEALILVMLQLIPSAQVRNTTCLIFSLEAEDTVFLRLLALREMQKVTMKINILKKDRDEEQPFPHLLLRKQCPWHVCF